MQISDKRLAANRAIVQTSTGPKTRESAGIIHEMRHQSCSTAEEDMPSRALSAMRSRADNTCRQEHRIDRQHHRSPEALARLQEEKNARDKQTHFTEENKELPMRHKPLNAAQKPLRPIENPCRTDAHVRGSASCRPMPTSASSGIPSGFRPALPIAFDAVEVPLTKPVSSAPRLSYTEGESISLEDVPGMDTRSLFIPAAGLALLLTVTQANAQSTATTPAPATAQTTTPSSQKAAGAKKDTVAKPMTAKQQRARDEKLKKELETPYRKWLDEDVVYIISDEERKAFHQLNTDEEREQFVEQFWLRRDPTPDTDENEFKEEHYRRIAYANEHFASGIPGWRTDRGRTYIQYGPPDEIEAHSSGGSYERPMSEGGGETETFPFEQWRYRYIDGVGQNIILEFVDKSMSGEYRMTMDPSEKDALLNVPNAGLTLYEQEGLSTKTDRFNRTDGTHLGVPDQYMNQSMNEFNRMAQFFKMQEPPQVKFKDLESAITSRVTYNVLPMQVHTDYLRVTESTVLANITLQFDNSDLMFVEKDGVDRAVINVFGRITSMTRRPIKIFEPTLETTAPPDMLEAYKNQKQIFQESIPLQPGRYHLNIMAKDIMSGNVAPYEVALDVPHFSEDRLAASTLILADQIEKLPMKSIGGTMFAIGDTKVRPKVGGVPKFKIDEKMGVYVQFYNFAPEEKTNKPDGAIQYIVSKVGSTESIIDFTEDLSSILYASANQVTVQKLLPLSKLGPGTYTLKVKAVDRRANQTVQQQENFIVN